MACWHNCCFKEGRQHSLKSVVVALLQYVRTKPICVKWNQGYPKQWNTTFFRKSFCVLRNNHTTLAIKKHTEHKVVRCWWSYTTKHKLVASLSTVRKLSSLDFPQTSNITSLHYHYNRATQANGQKKESFYRDPSYVYAQEWRLFWLKWPATTGIDI